MRAADVGNAVRLMIAGEDQITTYKEGDEQYDVTLQLLPEQQKNPEMLARLMIPSSQGRAGAPRQHREHRSAGLGPARIERFNRQFQVHDLRQQRARASRSTRPRGRTSEEIREGRPAARLLVQASSGSVKILDETTRNLILAFLLASIFMYMVLAAQFDSFLHPFTIMLSLPLSIPFALFSLWLTGRTLNLWSSLGVLLLLGIVKKNGILQVDYTNKLRAEGDAAARGDPAGEPRAAAPDPDDDALDRRRPDPDRASASAPGSAQRSAVAVTIIGGQMLCLLPTLLVTPVAYTVFAEMEQRGFKASLRSAWARMGAKLGRTAS